MADLVTRLLLNNTQFDESIRKSTQQVQSFQKMGEQVKTSITKFAGVLGIAVSASELFSTAINSNRKSQIEWNSALEGVQTSVNEFFTALSTGDWSIFEDGILNAISLAKEYRRQMMLAQDTLNLGKTKAERWEAEKENQEYLITSKNTTIEEKKTAHKAYKEAAQNEINERQSTVDFAFSSLKSGLEAKNITFIKTAEEFRNAFENLLDPKTSDYKLLSRFQQLKGEDRNKVQPLVEYWNQYGKHDKFNQDEVDAFKERMTIKDKSWATTDLTKQEFANKYREAVRAEMASMGDTNLLEQKLRFQNFYSGDEREEARAVLDEINEHIEKIGTARKDLDAADSDLADAIKEREEYENENALQTNQKNTKTDIPQKEEVIKTLGLDPIELSYTLSPTTLSDLQRQRAEIVAQMNNATQEDYLKLKVKLDAKDADIKKFKEGKYGKPEIKGLDIKQAKPLTFDKSNVKTTYDYASSLNAVASAMGAISSMTNEGASAWLTWTANLMTSIATAIPAIQALTTAKTAEAGANAVASATQTPVVGWLLAGAAAASVIAAMATMPKFAEGGIFEGNSTFGDMNLARVNAGEMILNNRQQRNLFNLLNNGGSSGASGGQVEFKISGKQLVGVLSNYNKQISRI